MVLLDAHFASTPRAETPVRKIPTRKVKSSPLKRKSPAISMGLDKQGLDGKAPVEDHNEDIIPAKKKKKKKKSKISTKDKRKSDISMKDVSPSSMPQLKSKTSTEQPELSQTGEPIYEFPDVRVDISAEVDEAMRQHYRSVERGQQAKKNGLNPAEKHKRESLDTASPSVEIKNKAEDDTSKAKKRKIHKMKGEGSKSEKTGLRGLLGAIERKRKSPSPGSDVGEPVVPVKDEAGKKSKNERKEKRVAKKARERAWKGSDRDGEGDVVMSD
jgi:hypothetical protein